MSEHYGNKISTVDEGGKRKWIYAMQPKGKLYNYRTLLSILYFVLFFGLPFIKVDGNPLFQFNIPQGKFILFGNLFLPQDFMILGVAMLCGLLFIIVFTLVFGRIFCGWICPQTIFMEMMFRKIEYWIEGPAHKQMAAAKKAEKPSSFYVRRVIKHIVFFIISFFIANVFLSYIIGIDELIKIITDPVGNHLVGLLSILGFTTVFYVVFAFVREIVCTVICPYGRLQSVLMDKNSIAVAYDYNRGEPRSKKRKSEEKVGDCIDCGMCVNVCPTGIDIRDGLQMECVGCTACIDACDMMMEKVNLPTRLITLASENQLEHNLVRKQLFNYRAKWYMGVLAILLGLLLVMLLNRSVFDSTILRVPGQLYQVHDDGSVTNLYKIKIVNKGAKTLPYHLKLGSNNGTLEFVGQKKDSLEVGKHTEETFFVKMPAEELKKSKLETEIEILIMSGDKVIQTKEVSFLSGF